jgi:hypothetical protein
VNAFAKGGKSLERTAVVIRCQNHDPQAFEELYKLNCGQAPKTAYLIAGEKGIAEDILKDLHIRNVASPSPFP